MSDFPEFKLDESRFDQSTFLGRLRHILVQFNPWQLLASDDSIERAKNLLEKYKAGTLPASVTNEKLWKAKELVETRLHPDTGEKITTPFCFAAYVPMQPIIVLGLTLPGGGMMNQAFWQWFNQSYNAMVWHANKNKSTPMTDEELMKAYAGSVGASIGLSVGVQKLGSALEKARPASVAASVVKGAAPFVGCVGAGWLSLLLMRQNEIVEGVFLKDEDGNQFGKSRRAGIEGIGQCMVARVAWSIPILALTPLFTNMYAKSRANLRHPRLRIPVNIAITTAMSCVGVYPAQAIFTQTARIPSSRVEAQFQNLKDKNGNPIKHFFYNKGL